MLSITRQQSGRTVTAKKKSELTHNELGNLSTLSHGCLKVHGGVPMVLCIFLDPLLLRINCLVIRELLNALFLNPESSILKL